MKKTVLDERDSVAVLLESCGDIPSGHKIARTDIRRGEYVYKYGEIIGVARCDIKKDELVHTHNLASALDEEREYTYEYRDCTPRRKESRTFMGYPRPDGSVGIRNDVYIIPTVGCVNGVCKSIEEGAKLRKPECIDRIVTLSHQFGCSQLGEDGENIGRLLAAAARNPNAAFVLIVGLGCENNTVDSMKKRLEDVDDGHVKFLVAQECEDEVSAGVKIIEDFFKTADNLTRVPTSVEKLCFGLKCGGSDGYSGITANPTVGRVSDLLISMGGSAVLTEVPEMFGAEQILMNRCLSAEVFEKYKQMILDFKEYYRKEGFPIYENPSPGNKAGGITTLEEKSLGCIKKGGTAPVVDVLDYAERVKKQGLSALCAPGNDLIAASALAAAGCQLVLFTTGRGTPFSTFVPTLKISTNSALADKKSGWIDFDPSGMDADALFELCLDVCSGDAECKSEQRYEIAFFKKGVTL